MTELKSEPSDEYVCAECGGAVRCCGGSFRRDLDGTVLGIAEGWECDDCGSHGTMVSTADGELHSVDGLVRR